MSSTVEAPLLRRVWRPIFRDGFVLVVGLALLAGAIRAWALLGPPQHFWVLPAGFVAMALAPFLLLSSEGRRQIGFRWPRRGSWLLGGVAVGGLSAFVLYGLGWALFGDTLDNWFVSVERSFPDTPQMAGLDTTQLFWAITVPALIFSPLGEEIFFRGMVHEVASQRLGDRLGLLVDAGFFAFVHVFHHGIVRVDGELQVFPLSGALWMGLIFGTGVLFAFLRHKTGSLLAPILSHAAFNFAMNATIFFLP